MKHAQTRSALLMIFAAAGLAVAQPAEKDSSDQDLLRGPEVKESGSTTSNSSDKKTEKLDEKSVKEHLEENPIEMRELFGSLRVLSTSQVASELRLNSDQEERIKTILQTYREEIRAFHEENRVEIRKLRDEMNKVAMERRERRQQAQKEQSDAGDTMQRNTRDEKPDRDSGESPPARKLREMINNSPAAKNAMKRIEATLSAPQMNAVKVSVVKQRLRREARAEDARGNARDNNARPARRGMDSDRADKERRERNQDRDRNKDSKREKPADD